MGGVMSLSGGLLGVRDKLRGFSRYSRTSPLFPRGLEFTELADVGALLLRRLNSRLRGNDGGGGDDGRRQRE